jgi:hypothetical protein
MGVFCCWNRVGEVHSWFRHAFALQKAKDANHLVAEFLRSRHQSAVSPGPSFSWFPSVNSELFGFDRYKRRDGARRSYGTRNAEFDTRSNLCPNPVTPTSDVGARRAWRPTVVVTTCL